MIYDSIAWGKTTKNDKTVRTAWVKLTLFAIFIFKLANIVVIFGLLVKSEAISSEPSPIQIYHQLFLT